MSIIEALVEAAHGRKPTNSYGDQLHIRGNYVYLGEAKFPLEVRDVLADYDIRPPDGSTFEDWPPT